MVIKKSIHNLAYANFFPRSMSELSHHKVVISPTTTKVLQGIKPEIPKSSTVYND